MPTTYTHYRFGLQVAERLPEDLKQIIYEYPELFYTGVHGPDILFYYFPWAKNKVNILGNDMHTWSGRKLFSMAGDVVKAGGFDRRDLSYMFGYLCHFALDRQAHAIVDLEAKRVGSTHTEIEAELDRILLVRDGYDPIRKILTKHLHPSLENAKVIAKFCPGVSVQQVLTAQKMNVFFLNQLVSPFRLKRQFLFGLLKAVGMYEGYKGLFINYQPNPACKEPVEKLLVRYDNAIPEAVTFITDFADTVQGDKPWNPLFAYNFDGQLTED